MIQTVASGSLTDLFLVQDINQGPRVHLFVMSPWSLPIRDGPSVSVIHDLETLEERLLVWVCVTFLVLSGIRGLSLLVSALSP